MNNSLLDLLSVDPKNLELSRLHSNALEQVAEELEEALCDPRPDSLKAISAELGILFKSVFQALPSNHKEAIRNSLNAANTDGHLFVAGQIGFAKHFASVAMAKRAENDFYDLFKASWVKPYIRALATSDLSSSELAKVIEAEPETVSRNLRKLRDVGISEFRKDGRSVINFLTPAARELWANLNCNGPSGSLANLYDEVIESEKLAKDKELQTYLKSLTRREPSHMQALPVMTQESA